MLFATFNAWGSDNPICIPRRIHLPSFAAPKEADAEGA